MKTIFALIFTFLLVQTSFSQKGLPDDYLSATFHKERREAFRNIMPENSVSVFFANPERNRANDVDYVYHQDPNFYYLTGYKEPNSVLVIFSQNQTNAEGKSFNEVLYVQERNAQREQWTGIRLGTEGAKQQLGFEMAFNGKDFRDSGIDYEKFDKVLFNNFENDYRDSKRDDADLYSLVDTFKGQIKYDQMPVDNAVKDRVYELIKTSEVKNNTNVVKRIEQAVSYYPELKEDKVINDYMNAKDDKIRMELKQQVIKIEAEAPKNNLDTRTLSTIMAGLRQVKTPEEMVLLKKAVRISAMGQREIMKAMRPGMSEAEVQGIHEYVYKKYGSEYEGYPSIVGAGNNGCVLHYIENSKMKLENDLVLMDLGAEYHGYTADVTRTIPANGKFTTEQKAIYDLVYEAQEAGIKATKIGNTLSTPDDEARKVINAGLVKLGIIKSEADARKYFPHGTSHHIGLDVHDPSLRGKLEANMVITVEPGIYIPEGSDCDRKWWGIAVRIEDDILITEKGPVNLSAEAPRKSSEIEALMTEKSILNDFVLPKLD
jgi:Xaa-Pro aminopeptidase